MAAQTNTVNLNTYKAKILSNTYGANNSPVYFNNGVPTILTTIGDTTKPVWVNNGVITEITGGTTAQFYRGDKSWSNTLTGSLVVSITKGTESHFVARASGYTDSKNLDVKLMVGSGKQNHGVYSTGYSTDGNAFTASAKWIVYRNSAGNIFLNGNADSATILQTSRKLWGNSFNGSADVDGSINLGDEKTVIGKITRKKDGGGGWAYAPFRVIDNAGTDFAHFGVYGNANTLTYIYIGPGEYNTTSNIRINSSGNLVIPNDGIYYTGTKATYRMIRFIDNTTDTYGNGISIGGGGQTVIGGGESADTAVGQLSTNGSEIMYVCNDGDIHLFTNMQNGWANRKDFSFNTGGSLTVPASLATGTAITAGTYVYATTYLQAYQHVYNDTGHYYMKYNNTWYDVLHNHANGNVSVNAAGTGLYVGYYNTTLIDWLSGRMQLKDGCLSIFPNNSSYREGIRIHATGSWSDITLCGNDNTGDSGTSANSWFIGNNNGNFYIARNGSPGTTAWLECVSNVWSTMNPIWIKGGSTEAGANANRLTTTSGMPGNMQYNVSRRGTQIYSNGIAFCDPYNGNSNSDAGWIRQIETTGNTGYLEIGVGDDGSEEIIVRQYKTDNTVGRQMYLLNSSGFTSVSNQSTDSSYAHAAMQIREANYAGASSDTWGVAPRLAWHWSGRVAAQIGLASNGYLYEAPSTGTTFYKLVYESGTWGISISGNATTATTADKVVHTATGTLYISGAKGTNAAVFAKKATGSVWYPAVALQTSGGGAWQIGNYDDETLEFQYATKANIDSSTNTTSEIYMQNGDTGRVMTSGNYTNWCPSKTGDSASGSWGISVTGSSASCTGNAATATQVKVTNFGFPSSGSTTHYITSCDSTTTGNQDIKDTAHLYLYENTTSSYLNIGSSGTTGGMTLWKGTGHVDIVPTTITANTTRNQYLPNVTGWIAVGGNGSSTGVGGQYAPVYLSTSGVLTEITAGTTAQFYRGDKTWSNTLTGLLTLYREGTTANDYPAGITFSVKDTTTGQTYSSAWIYVYQDHAATTYGTNMVIKSGGNMAIGAGESAGSLYSGSLVANGSENMYVLADGTTYVYANANTIANRIGFAVSTSGHILPQKAEAANNNAQKLGASNNKWANVYATTFTGNLSGNATTATEGKYLMNRGGSTVTIADSSWAIQITPSGHTNRATVFSQNWKQSGLTYTPSGGSATAVSDTADFKIWLSSSNTSNSLQANMQIDGRIYALGGFQGALTGNVTGNCSGSSGSCTGNAASATTATVVGSYFRYQRVVACPEQASGTAGWRRVCKVSSNHSYPWFLIQLNGVWNTGAPSNALLIANTRSSTVYLTQLSGIAGTISKVRMVHVSGGTHWLDVYVEAVGSGATRAVQYVELFGDVEVSEIQNSNAVYSTSVTAAAEVAITNITSGINITSSNYTDYTVKKDGTGASGTWGISVTGSAAKLGTSNVGNSTRPIYLEGGTPKACKEPANKAWFTTIPKVDASGVMEIGKTIDFHWANTTDSDYTGRLYLKSADILRSTKTFSAPAWETSSANDIAECRFTEDTEPGRCVTENFNGIMTRTTKRLQPACKIISDTYGMTLGVKENCHTPIAIAGRVLAYPYRAREEYELGAAVCSAPNGTVDIMTRDEIMMYPERIVGTVSEIPDYEVWLNGENEDDEWDESLKNRKYIPVNGRIWIYVR